MVFWWTDPLSRGTRGDGRINICCRDVVVLLTADTESTAALLQSVYTRFALSRMRWRKKRRTSLCSYTIQYSSLSHSISKNSSIPCNQYIIPSVPSAHLHDHSAVFGERCRALCWRSSRIPDDDLELLHGKAPGTNSAKVFYPKSRRLRLGHRAFHKPMSQTWFQIHTETAVGHQIGVFWWTSLKKHLQEWI